MKKVKRGLWTPWAKVICFECHGPVFDTFRPKTFDVNSDEWKEKVTALEIEEGNGVTTCDQCGQPIQLNDSIAQEHNLVLALRKEGIDAEMEQTGGMNSACSITKPENTDECPAYYLITYNMDGDDGFWIGSYRDGESVDEDFNTQDLQVMVEYIKKLPDVPKIPADGGDGNVRTV